MKKLLALLASLLGTKRSTTKNDLIQLDSEKESKSKFHLAIGPKILIVWTGLLALIDFVIRWFLK